MRRARELYQKYVPRSLRRPVAMVRHKLASIKAEPRPHGFYLDAEPWMLNELSIRGNELCASGFFLAPHAGRPTFRVNGHSVSNVRSWIETDGLHQFWRRSNKDRTSFEFEFPLRESELLEDFIEVECAYEGQPLRYAFQSKMYLPKKGLIPIADPERRVRVSGTRDEFAFTQTGCTLYKHLVAALDAYGIPFKGEVLDWGCGCGRLSAHLSRHQNVNLHGTDIDADNVEWCQKNIAEGKFSVSTLLPPTAYANDQFDLIVGMSIFTHLREPAQDAWLAELRRITRTGGYVLTTVHSRTTLSYVPLDEPTYWRLDELVQAIGFVVTANNGQLAAQIPDEQYYVDVFHSHNYIHWRWSKYFEVIDILPGFNGAQDLVVMRKR